MTRNEAKHKVVEYWIRKAETALRSADAEYAAKRYDFAVNRAYFACFYSASAVLLQGGHKFVKHTGVRAAVHRHLIKAGKLDSQWGALYDRIFENRQSADYLELHEFEVEQVQEILQDAKAFLKEMQRIVAADTAGTG